MTHRLVLKLAPELVQAVTDLHRVVGGVGPEQHPAWEPIEAGRSKLWAVTGSAREVAAAAGITLHYSRRQLACTARSVRGPVARSLDHLRLHLQSLVPALEACANDFFIQPRVPGASADEIIAATGPLGFQPATGLGSAGATLIVDLAAPLEVILAGFHAPTRRQVRSAARRGLQCQIVGSDDEMRDLLNRYNCFARSRLLSEVQKAAALKMFHSASGLGGLPLLLPVAAIAGGRTVGGAFFIIGGERLVYQWGFTDRTAGEPLPISHACFWHAIEAVHGRGVNEFDLGGYWTERGERDPINRFKLGFGGRLERYGPKLQLQFTRRLRWRALVPGSSPSLPGSVQSA